MTTTEPRRRRDSGTTFVELVVVVGILGILSTVIAAAVSVVFRTDSGVTATISASHDLQQVINYFQTDVQSGPIDEDAYRETSGQPAGTGCSDSGDDNIFRFDDGARRIAYRVVVDGAEAHVDRYVCAFVDGNWVEWSVDNLVDSLDADGPPAEVEIDTDGDDVSSVTLHLTFGDRSEEMTASPRAQRSAEPVSPSDGDGPCPSSPLDPTLGFGAFVAGDVTLDGGEVEGTLALGSDLRWDRDLHLAKSDKNNSYSGVALYVSEVDWTDEKGDTLKVSASTGGDVAIGDDDYYYSSDDRLYQDSSHDSSNIEVKQSDDVVGLADVGVIDFDGRFDTLVSCSAALTMLSEGANSIDPLATNCESSYSGSGDLCLRVDSDGINVLTIPESVLDTVGTIDIDGPPPSETRPLIINVIDDGDGEIALTTESDGWDNSGQAKNVLWNFPNTTELTIDERLWGSVLAPLAHVITEADVTGAIVADRWSHEDGTISNDGDNRFDEEIDWSSMVSGGGTSGDSGPTVDCPSDPFEPAVGFGAFVLGDVDLDDGEMTGTLALGGALSWSARDNKVDIGNVSNRDYGNISLYATSIAWSNSGNDDLTVEQDDDQTEAVVIGSSYHEHQDTLYEDSERDSNTIDVDDIATVTDLAGLSGLGVTAIDFSAAFDSLEECSVALASLTGRPNVISVSESNLGSFGVPNGVNPSAELPLVINVVDDGDGQVTVPEEIDDLDDIAEHVIWNFPTATSVTVDLDNDRDDFHGSILAPLASLTVRNEVRGTIVAASWTLDLDPSKGTIENGIDGNTDRRFDGSIAW